MKYMRIRNQSLAKKILISGKKVCKMYCGKCGHPLGKGGVCFYCGNRMTTCSLQAQSRNVFSVLCILTVALHVLITLCGNFVTYTVLPLIDEDIAESFAEMEAYGFEMPSLWWSIIQGVVLLGVSIILLQRKNLRWSVPFLIIAAILGLMYMILVYTRAADAAESMYMEEIKQASYGMTRADIQAAKDMWKWALKFFSVAWFVGYRMTLAPIALLSATVFFVRDRKVFDALMITSGILFIAFSMIGTFLGASTGIPMLFLLFMGLSLRKDYQTLEMERKR